ncbi:MAG: dockerin type I repeat-containing protein [Candidatus Woesearchaeota archaeon]
MILFGICLLLSLVVAFACIDGQKRFCESSEFSSSRSHCDRGYEYCIDGVWSGCTFFGPMPFEICGDNIDNTCDGHVDTLPSNPDYCSVDRRGVLIDNHTYWCGAIERCGIIGDINMDGVINNVDAIILNNFLEGMVSFNNDQAMRADINGDGIIDEKDYIALLEYVLSEGSRVLGNDASGNACPARRTDNARGVCPADFADQFNEIAFYCGGYFLDSDCLDTSLSFSRQISFDAQVLRFINATNSAGAQVTQLAHWDRDATVDYRFIVRGSHASNSITTLVFEKPDEFSLFTLFFDGNLIEPCNFGNLYQNPYQNHFSICYEQHENNNIITLDIHHPLSVHFIDVRFEKAGIPIALFLLIVLGVVLPLFLMHVLRIRHFKHIDLHVNLFKHKVHEVHMSYDKVKKYVDEALGQGHSETDIRQHLYDRGWDGKVIDMVFYDVHMSHEDIDKLKAYIQHAVKKGHSKQDIVATLQKAKWQDKQIKKAFEELQHVQK